MSLKLYYSPGACSLAPHIVLHEAGLAHEAILASTKTHKLRDGTDFYTINPLGYVPLLELEDGRRLTEGAAIMQYLADLVPDKQLAPANGTWERYQLQSRLNFISSELHKNFGPLFKPGTSEDARQAARQALHARFTYVDQELARQPYFNGPHFSIADAYLFTVAGWGRHANVDLSTFSHLQAYLPRIAERPAVQAAVQAEGLGK